MKRDMLSNTYSSISKPKEILKKKYIQYLHGEKWRSEKYG